MKHRLCSQIVRPSSLNNQPLATVLGNAAKLAYHHLHPIKPAIIIIILCNKTDHVSAICQDDGPRDSFHNIRLFVGSTIRSRAFPPSSPGSCSARPLSITAPLSMASHTEIHQKPVTIPTPPRRSSNHRLQETTRRALKARCL